MATLAYHGDSDVDRLANDLRNLAWLHRAVGIMGLVNTGLPWVAGVAIQTALDYMGQPVPQRHLHLTMPNDMDTLGVLAAVMSVLAASAWMSARLIDRRRGRWISVAVAVVEAWYIPFGTVAAVRAGRLLFRRDVVEAYRASAAFAVKRST